MTRWLAYTAIALALIVSIDILKTPKIPAVPAADTVGIAKDKAIEIARSNSPLKTIESASTTPPGPVWWSLIGTDSEGRSLAVWVSYQGVEGQVYLGDHVTANKAMDIVRNAGYQPVSEQPVLVNPNSPYWSLYVFVEQTPAGNIISRPVRVDLKTGAIVNP